MSGCFSPRSSLGRLLRSLGSLSYSSKFLFLARGFLRHGVASLLRRALPSDFGLGFLARLALGTTIVLARAGGLGRCGSGDGRAITVAIGWFTISDIAGGNSCSSRWSRGCGVEWRNRRTHMY
jgi:hypothetical protein